MRWESMSSIITLRFLKQIQDMRWESMSSILTFDEKNKRKQYICKKNHISNILI